jgi:hypothetical protein
MNIAEATSITSSVVLFYFLGTDGALAHRALRILPQPFRNAFFVVEMFAFQADDFLLWLEVAVTDSTQISLLRFLLVSDFWEILQIRLA